VPIPTIQHWHPLKLPQCFCQHRCCRLAKLENITPLTMQLQTSIVSQGMMVGGLTSINSSRRHTPIGANMDVGRQGESIKGTLKIVFYLFCLFSTPFLTNTVHLCCSCVWWSVSHSWTRHQ
jgi:hypothetical protein